MLDKYIGVIITVVLSLVIAIAWVLMEDTYQKNKEDYDKSDWP